MPRESRIDSPGALHHIILRGIERNDLFKDYLDHHNFLDRLGKILSETSTSCYAWDLMTNHVHLLLRTGRVSISKVMARLLTGYAQQFNRRHKRHGHLFQNRYKSFFCEEKEKRVRLFLLTNFLQKVTLFNSTFPGHDSLKHCIHGL